MAVKGGTDALFSENKLCEDAPLQFRRKNRRYYRTFKTNWQQPHILMLQPNKLAVVSEEVLTTATYLDTI